ncbi:conserved hypothetical protein [Verticillium alfalfae VaMs.102]|uniref:Heterokaryon incompatibility domain-containing protein n=1 Tax=Verticillium alfalfae (strain VaMs.102 / ATCC MYA-4576 / FGSC 10136) TaxID=526221 RepID=C9SEM7_VERA1|nr:conserved hypothetical protein [Verticillium alfalfae VaMs.102]EEY16620.1 conserved hypothetical protein [Verticillium alfalfae VaMs.102]
MGSLKAYSHAPLLDGYHVNNYVETLEALPAIHGLNAIRLLTIEPGKQGEPLVGHLTRHFADDCPSYLALSYTWKKATFTQPITINGAPFLVTENVEKALDHLRYEDKPRTVWLDSICIDQRNVIEKNYQVRLMNKIYLRSEAVICWVGVPEEDEDELNPGEHMDIGAAFDLARAIEEAGSDAYPEVVARHPPVALFTLLKLTERSYFRRQWVIQEVCLSESVTLQVGEHQLSWSAIAAAADGIAKFGQDHRASLLFPGSNRIFDLFGIRAMNFCRERTDHGVFANDLIDLLRTCRGRELTDPRDMIYSLLGICGPKSQDVDIDYRKPVHALYREVTAATILRTRDLDFLRLSDHRSRDEGLPSWSPNWTHIWAGSWQIRSLRFKGYPPKERGGIVPGSDDVVFSEDLRRLTVKGAHRYTIACVQDPSTIPEDPDSSITDADCYAQLARVLIQTEYLVTYHPRPGQSREERRVEFVGSLRAAFTGGQDVRFTPEQWTTWYDAIVTRTTDGLPTEEREIWSLYNAKLLKWLHEAQYFLTDAGILGVAERVTGVRVGDPIVSFKGATEDSLFAIRKFSDRGDYVLLNGIFMAFTEEEEKAHVQLVDDLNDGKVKTEKYVLV